MTNVFVRNGFVQESNPLMESIVREGNFLLLKVIGVLLCGLILWLIYKRFSKVILIVTSSIAVFYGAVIAWNMSLLFRGFSF